MIGTTYSARLTAMSQAATSLTAQIAKAQEQAVTGLTITRPSDAPELISTLHGLSSQLSDQSVWSGNAETAKSYLDAAEDALAGMTDLISTARQLATQFGSESYSAEDLQAGAVEVQGLIDELVSLANTDVAGRYIFAGNAYDAPAYDASGTYLGASEAPSTRTGSGQEAATGFVGSDFLQGDVDILATLSSLVTALQAGDHEAVAGTLGDLEAATQQLSDARTVVATEYNSADDALTIAANMEALLTTAIEDKAAADPVEVYTRLASLQTTYESVLQITASSQSQNLFAML